MLNRKTIFNFSFLTKDMAAFTRLSADKRYQQLEDLVYEIKRNENAYKYLLDWGLELDDGLHTVNFMSKIFDNVKL